MSSMSALSWVFYVIFAAILVWMYVSIRRGWNSPGFVAGAGLVGCVITMLLLSIAQGNEPLHAVVVGLALGTLFSGIVLGTAWWFRTKALRAGNRS